jgi:hypothetical protein
MVSESSHSQAARRNEYARQGSARGSDVAVAQSLYLFSALSYSDTLYYHPIISVYHVANAFWCAYIVIYVYSQSVQLFLTQLWTSICSSHMDIQERKKLRLTLRYTFPHSHTNFSIYE